MSAENIVVVESPAKAKTINRYLGPNYKVLASYGHVRDLPAKDGSVEPEHNFKMHWKVDSRGKRQLDAIAKEAKTAKNLILATDPDREGEAISWHIREELLKKRGLKHLVTSRVVFHEITKKAILKAMEAPLELNVELVDAYLARRALDYLVGFTLSPVLWRKLPGAKSAGRVQSVALRLICERESEIEIFNPREYWSVRADLAYNGLIFPAQVSSFEGKPLRQYDIATKAQAEQIEDVVKKTALKLVGEDNRRVKRNPYAPFTTSTLQQDASRRLRFGTGRTMQIAQKLYEGVPINGETSGLITYMRTDSTTLSEDFLGYTRHYIEETYGTRYLPSSPRRFKTKSKNAQEAHEAVRPTDIRRTPERMSAFLDADQLKLYTMIWKRTVACQMAQSEIDQKSLVFSNDKIERKIELKATGSVVAFDGFRKVYAETQDEDKGKKEGDVRLPVIALDEAVDVQEVFPKQHFTQPPPRYTEASLVKKMEELGIGRPSTYASVVQVLQARNYVRLEQRRFMPEDRGRLLTSFLSGFFSRYVDYDFTAHLEQELDEISNGKQNWVEVLKEFWGAFHQAVDTAMGLPPAEVRKALDEDLGQHFFTLDDQGSTESSRLCPLCKKGRLSLDFGRHGAYIKCSNYPECHYTRNVGEDAGSPDGDMLAYPMELGIDTDTNEPVSLRKGPYGIYVQRGESAPKSTEKAKPKTKEKTKEKANPKPKRVSLLKDMDPANFDLKMALKLLSLPRDLGLHPETQKMVQAGAGPYGPYLRYNGRYTSLPADDDVLSIGFNRAIDILATQQQKTKGRVLGMNPENEQEVTVQEGRYGPYVKWGRINATLPKTITQDSITLEQALELIKAKQAAPGSSKKSKAKKATTKKSTVKKTATKKTTAKKVTTKKSTAKKTAAKKTAAKKAVD